MFNQRVLLLCLTTAAVARAAQVSGSVQDPTGHPVENARVSLGSRTGIIAEGLTDAQGKFRFPLEGINRQVTVAADGFATQKMDAADDLSIVLPLAAQSDSINVAGSAIDALASEQGTSTSLISREQLRGRNEAQAIDLLRYLPGLAVTQQGQRGTLGAVSIRGGDSKYNLVLLDGAPVNTFYYGGLFDFAHIPVDFLDRVEVARGPQSAVYGSYANSGVINFVTRSAETPVFDFVAEGGSHGERRIALSGSGLLGKFGLAGSVSRLDFNGPVPNSDYLNQNVYLSVLRKWDRHTLSARGNYNANDTGEPGPYGSDPAHRYGGLDRVSRSRNYFSDYLAHYAGELSPRVRQEMFLSFFLNNSPYVSPYGFSYNKDIRALADARTTVNVARWYTTAFGFAEEREEMKNTYVQDASRRKFPLRRDQQGLYWENRFQLGSRLFVNAGVREEIFEQPFIPSEPASPYYATRPGLASNTYHKTNPKIAAVYRVAPSTSVHGSFGTGIRPPGGSDLAFTDNPNLRPERTKSGDAGVQQRLLQDRLALNATYFVNRFSDQIVGLGGSLSVLNRYRTGNLSRSQAQGGEFTADLRPLRWLNIAGNYTFLQTKVESLEGSSTLVQRYFTVGQPLLRRPKQSGSLVASIQFRRVSANVTGYFRGQTLDIEPNYGVSGGLYRNGGYQNLGLNLNYRLTHGVTVYGYLRNALNQRYEELYGYPSPLLNFTAGAKWTFGRGR